ncbi:RNA polymerase subunit sigma-70 [Clostridium neonatale]|uniref:RNA polymerase subunit sigma-70 n=1 Tax=Clostridium neonatale TaxID=137838 RepID=A0A2A7MCF6_9CLOT|nr:sigma factor-like helix-turn-helix DNA-binding protein [Clostridium neonatale]PEG27108.1 RNA polymerase subunit sigma-70 [Clostridium neonatale]PEG29250.1 RNA polymerase subunit sigma-70 [Clostridium neonatale]CAH0435471.1 Putative sigma factor [Clostridium neonatale]
MNITYEFVTGEKIEIEVNEDIANISIEIEKKIYKSERRETRRHNSIDSMEEEGFQFEDINDDIEVKVEEAETTDEIKNAIKTLIPNQQDLIEKIFYKDMKIVDIAEYEGVTEAAIRNRLNKIYKKLKKILN